MRLLLIPTTALLLSIAYGKYIHTPYQYAAVRQSRNQQTNGVFKSLGDFFQKMHAAATKRCAYLLDESCNNGGIPGAGSDNDWLTQGFNPGKRALNLFEEGAANDALPGSGADSDWLNDGFNPGKRCVNTMDESCSNGGIPGAGSDSDWLDGGFNPGKRNINQFQEPHQFNRIAAAADLDWLKSGRRCVNVMDESCGNGGIPGSGPDRDWLDGGFNPGKRRVSEAEGVPGAGNDNDWLNGDNSPGKR